MAAGKRALLVTLLCAVHSFCTAQMMETVREFPLHFVCTIHFYLYNAELDQKHAVSLFC